MRKTHIATAKYKNLLIRFMLVPHWEEISCTLDHTFSRSGQTKMSQKIFAKPRRSRVEPFPSRVES